MITQFLNCIRQIAVFMLCAKVLLYLKPKGCYEKYIKLLVSIMILSQFLTPITGRLSGKGDQAMWDTIRKYEKQFQISDMEGADRYEDIWGIMAALEADKYLQERNYVNTERSLNEKPPTEMREDQQKPPTEMGEDQRKLTLGAEKYLQDNGTRDAGSDSEQNPDREKCEDSGSKALSPHTEARAPQEGSEAKPQITPVQIEPIQVKGGKQSAETDRTG